MTAAILLERLEKVRQVTPRKWQARCPAHEDRSPSLHIKEEEDGRVLIHCFAQCGAADILSAVGLDFTALYPARASNQYLPRVHRPWSAYDGLVGVAFESLVVLQYAKAMARGEILSDRDRERLLVSATRIQRAYEVSQ